MRSKRGPEGGYEPERELAAVGGVLLYFGNPQCTQRLARKPKLYHHVPENHSPQFGQRQTLSLTPQTARRAIQTNAATKPGVKVWNNLKDRTAMPKHMGTYVANRMKSLFLIRLYSRQSSSYSFICQYSPHFNARGVPFSPIRETVRALPSYPAATSSSRASVSGYRRTSSTRAAA